jgi:hypothetical protein
MAHAGAAATSPDASTPLAPLPREVALAIFARLPVDVRARCAAVCPGWRAFLAAERSLWTRLDLSVETGGVTRAFVTEALLRGAAARARGGLQALLLPAWHAADHEAMLGVVAAHGEALRELRVPSFAHWEQLEAVAHAAPRLRAFETSGDAHHVTPEALRALRREPPFAGLRLRHLTAGVSLADEEEALPLAAALAAHAGLDSLHLHGPLQPARAAPAALDAVVDAALARRVSELQLWSCGLSPASAPALARLLRSSAAALTELWLVSDGDGPLLDARAAALLCGALRENGTLTLLTLSHVGLFDDLAIAVAILSALHPRLRALDLEGNYVGAADAAAVGCALRTSYLALPLLHTLNVNNCALGDAGLRPLLEALPSSGAHLRELECADNGASDAVLRDALLPAVRAGASLRFVRCDAQTNQPWLHPPWLREVEALLQARLDADA